MRILILFLMFLATFSRRSHLPYKEEEVRVETTNGQRPVYYLGKRTYDFRGPMWLNCNRGMPVQCLSQV